MIHQAPFSGVVRRTYNKFAHAILRVMDINLSAAGTMSIILLANSYSQHIHTALPEYIPLPAASSAYGNQPVLLHPGGCRHRRPACPSSGGVRVVLVHFATQNRWGLIIVLPLPGYSAGCSDEG